MKTSFPACIAILDIQLVLKCSGAEHRGHGGEGGSPGASGTHLCFKNTKITTAVSVLFVIWNFLEIALYLGVTAT